MLNVLKVLNDNDFQKREADVHGEGKERNVGQHIHQRGLCDVNGDANCDVNGDANCDANWHVNGGCKL